MALSKSKSALSATDITSGFRSQMFQFANGGRGDLQFLTLHGTSVGELVGAIKKDIEVEAPRDAFLQKVNSISNIASPGNYRFNSASMIGFVSGDAIWDGDSYKRELRRAIFVPEEIRGWHNEQSYTLRCSGQLSKVFEDHLNEGDILVISGGSSTIYDTRNWTKTYVDLTGPKVTRDVKMVHLKRLVPRMQPAVTTFAHVVNGNRHREPLGQRKGYLYEDHHEDNTNNHVHATLERKKKTGQPVDGLMKSLQKSQSKNRRMKIVSGANKVNGLVWILVLILAIVFFSYLLCNCMSQC